jgi:hypothetical protein
LRPISITSESRSLTDWNIVESCPPIEKFEHLCKALSVAFPDGKGKWPLQTIVELFEFRKALAHGKTKIAMEGPATRDVNDRLDGDLGKRPTLHWERLIATKDFAERAREDVEAALLELHAARPDPKEGLFAFGIGLHSASMK